MNEIVLQQPMPAPKMPPRVQRNRSELDKLLAAKGIKSEWPAVENQVFTHFIKGLPVASYNPSIVRYRGKLVMTYRFHETTLKTKIGIAELDENFTVVYSETLNLDEEETMSLEDSRLFIWKNDLWTIFVVSTWPNFPSCQVKIAKLYKPDHWRYSDKEQYWLPDRQTLEKNHVPIVHDDVFNIIYKSNQPQEGDLGNLCQIIYSPFEKREMKTPAMRWPYGEIHGGTIPIPYKDKLISFFHSRLNNFMPPTDWCYFMGCIIRKSEPPFQMLSISKRPIVRGSELGGISSRFHFKPKVILPLGGIEIEDGFLISAGINDSASALIKITEKDLNL